jgi:23S rRNA (adenine2503-C2)-methyltransferase
MTDLGRELRTTLERHFTIDRLQIVRTATSADGSCKYLFRLADGNHIESVLIPEKNHTTLCISSQVGCAQGCRFCRTAQSGFTRNLTTGEIVAQVRDIAQTFEPSPAPINIVLMGMGEPLANYRNLVHALDIITDGNSGLGVSGRRVTLSTAGLAERLTDLGRDTSVNLAISLNAADDKTRSQLMPINRRYPLAQLLAACRCYPLKPRNRITFEYILIAGLNDRPAHARRLADLLRPIRAKINLIPFNDHPGCGFRRPAEPAILAFQGILHDRGYTAIVRHSRGRDISAACGQLRAAAGLNEARGPNGPPAAPGRLTA